MTQTITILITLIAITIAFFWKSIKLYVYTVKCLRNIEREDFIQQRYQVIRDGEKTKNVRMSFWNILYTFAFIPNDVPQELIQEYLQHYLQLIEDSMSAQQLYGLIRTETEQFTLDDDNKTRVVLYKFHPVVYRPKAYVLLLWLLAIAASIIIIHSTL